MRSANGRPKRAALRGVPSGGGASEEAPTSSVRDAGAEERRDSSSPLLGCAPVVIELAGLKLKSPNAIRGTTRGAAMAEARRKQGLRDIAKGNVLARAPRLSLVGIARADLKAAVTIVREAPKAFDDDNYVASCKALRDGIADAFQVADNHPCLEFWYEQRTSKTYGVRIEIRFERAR